LGTVVVRQFLKVPCAGSLRASLVFEGRIRLNAWLRVMRDGVVVYVGEISCLKRFKDDVREVQNGYECGISVEGFNVIKVGDHLECYEVVEERRTLEV